jgi:hypothetical protein
VNVKRPPAVVARITKEERVARDRFQEIWDDDARMQAILDRAFQGAVRRHRAADVPMAMWEDGEVREVSPFDIPLPEDTDEPPKRPG